MKKYKMIVCGLTALCVLTGCQTDVDTEIDPTISVINQDETYGDQSGDGNVQGSGNTVVNNDNDTSAEITSQAITNNSEVVQDGSSNDYEHEEITNNSENSFENNEIENDGGTVVIGSGNNVGENIGNNTDNSVHAENINVYVDKVMTELTDINGRTVQPFADNGEVYVPLTSLGGILGEAVEYDRQTKAVYVGESPNRSTNMLDFIHGYDPRCITEYSFLENKGKEHFSMAGKDYTDGMTAVGYNYDDIAYVSFNLEGKYNNISFNFGHLDGSTMNPTRLIITLDGYVEQEIDVNAEDYPISVDLDVSNAMQLRFELNLDARASYAFTNMVLT